MRVVAVDTVIIVKGFFDRLSLLIGSVIFDEVKRLPLT
jgi:hypothetical protein